MYFIRSGTVKMMDEGKLLPPGSFFGEIAIFEDSQRTFTALAAGQVELCVLKREDFNQVMQLHPISANLINGAIKKKKEAEAKAKAEAEMKERMEHIAINMSKKGNPLLERRLPMALGSMRSLAAAASNTSLAIKNGTMKRLFKQNQEGRKD
jgi:CRP-like cAMP-binding protein